MRIDLPTARFIVAGYGLPGEIGIASLLGAGCRPQQILLLTHPLDNRNQGLHSTAQLRGLTLLDDDPTSSQVTKAIADFRPDLIVSLHYRKRIPKEALAIARMGGVNLHPSLLPKHRGANSIPWAIIDGDQDTGFTYHKMEHDFDTGNILLQKRASINANDTAFSLFHRLIVESLPHLLDVVEMALSGKEGEPQSGESSYHGRELPYRGMIDSAWSPALVERFIRAMYFPPLEPARVVIEHNIFFVETFQEYRDLLKLHGKVRT